MLMILFLSLQPSRLLLPWLKEFLTKVTELQPKFLALHMQEVGGKTYEKSMEYVQEFIKNLCAATELNDYNVCRIYLDEDFNTAEHFTVSGELLICWNYSFTLAESCEIFRFYIFRAIFELEFTELFWLGKSWKGVFEYNQTVKTDFREDVD